MSKLDRLGAKLTPQQRNAAIMLVERDLTEQLGGERKRLEDIATEVGVTRNTLYKWSTQNRAFIDYVNALADDFLDAKRSLVYRQLMKLIVPKGDVAPSVKAIDLFMRRYGLLTDKQVVETKETGGANGSNGDIAKDIDELDALLAEVPNEN